MKIFLTIAACVGLMVTGLQATEEIKPYDASKDIWIREILEMIIMRDGSMWVLLGDHWCQAKFYGHASWCPCDILGTQQTSIMLR